MKRWRGRFNILYNGRCIILYISNGTAIALIVANVIELLGLLLLQEGVHTTGDKLLNIVTFTVLLFMGVSPMDVKGGGAMEIRFIITNDTELIITILSTFLFIFCT